MSTFVLGPNQTAWLAALRSGEFKQTKNALRTDKGFCCLGVACEINIEPLKLTAEVVGAEYLYNTHSAILPSQVIKHLALHTANGSPKNSKEKRVPMHLRACSHMNDHLRYSFDDLAKHLEKYAEFYFKKSK